MVKECWESRKTGAYGAIDVGKLKLIVEPDKRSTGEICLRVSISPALNMFGRGSWIMRDTTLCQKQIYDDAEIENTFNFIMKST